MSKPALWVPQRAEIIYIEHSPHAGKEMPGLHPLLVMSSAAFNQRSGIVIGFPMTPAAFDADNPFAVAVQGPEAEVGYVLAFQPKSIDWRARKTRRYPWGEGHVKVLSAAMKKMDAICGFSGL